MDLPFPKVDIAHNNQASPRAGLSLEAGCIKGLLLRLRRPGSPYPLPSPTSPAPRRLVGVLVRLHRGLVRFLVVLQFLLLPLLLVLVFLLRMRLRIGHLPVLIRRLRRLQDVC